MVPIVKEKFALLFLGLFSSYTGGNLFFALQALFPLYVAVQSEPALFHEMRDLPAPIMTMKIAVPVLLHQLIPKIPDGITDFRSNQLVRRARRTRRL